MTPESVPLLPRRLLGVAIRPARLSWSLRRHESTLLDKVTVSLVALILLVALIGPLVAPDVYASHIRHAFQAPSGGHWFGTDDQGRDVLWRVIVGCRASLGAAIVIVFGYGLIGTVVAAVASIGPRWLDEVLMRFTDAVLAFPGLLFALAVTAALGAGVLTVMAALVLTGWPMTARLLRGIMREKMAMPFVQGARTLGVSRSRLMGAHVLPNALPALWVKWASDIGNTVITVGALSFVGAGAQPPTAEWGAMVAAAQGHVTTAWWVALFPGLAIAVTAVAFGLLGDMVHLRTDPAVRQQAAASLARRVPR
jgi:peptide/nickel transport system permease protein